MRKEPEEIPDEDHEWVIERACAIDVAKASGTVCTRLPSQGGSGRRVSRVWDVVATTETVLALAAQLVALEIEKVTVESTPTTGGCGSTCWKPPVWICSWSTPAM